MNENVRMYCGDEKGDKQREGKSLLLNIARFVCFALTFTVEITLLQNTENGSHKINHNRRCESIENGNHELDSEVSAD